MEGNTHARVARAFLEAAAREFADGDELQASEKMWGAATHAIRCVMRSRGWRNGKTKAMEEAVAIIASELGNRNLVGEFAYFRDALHSNFYHGFLETDVLEDALIRVRVFVDGILPDSPPAAVEYDVPPQQVA